MTRSEGRARHGLSESEALAKNPATAAILPLFPPGARIMPKSLEGVKAVQGGSPGYPAQE